MSIIHDTVSIFARQCHHIKCTPGYKNGCSARKLIIDHSTDFPTTCSLQQQQQQPCRQCSSKILLWEHFKKEQEKRSIVTRISIHVDLQLSQLFGFYVMVHTMYMQMYVHVDTAETHLWSKQTGQCSILMWCKTIYKCLLISSISA